jgi:hypothetical protein
MRIQTYLRTTFSYSLTTPPPQAGRDPVDYFLFDAPGGFCSYFASAMAVLLRVNGVPARVASGYATGSYDSERQAYRISAGDAHAWVEVYFPGLGWVEFEPTTSQTAFTYAPGSTGGGPIPASTPPAPGSPAPGMALAILLGALALGIGLLALLWRLASRPPSPGMAAGGPGSPALAAWQARQLYFSVRRALLPGSPLPAPPWLKRRLSPAEKAAGALTPAEFLETSRPALARRPRLLHALEQATALYEQAAFSPRPPAQTQVETARRAWQAAGWEWLKKRISDFRFRKPDFRGR